MDFAPHTERTFEKGSQEQRLQELEESGGHAARLRLLGRMTSSFVLDTRQPLAVIVTDCGTAQRLLASGRDTTEQMEVLLSRIVECARWADEVIGFADRMIARRVSTLALVDINSLAKSAVQFSQCESFSRAVTLHLAQSPGRALALGDELQLLQVVVTLLVSTLQQHPARKAERHAVHLCIADIGDEIVLDIGAPLTSGNGKLEDQRKRTTKADAEVVMCRSIVEAHQGALECRRGRSGVMFRMMLPRVSDRLERSHCQSEPSSLEDI